MRKKAICGLVLDALTACAAISGAAVPVQAAEGRLYNQNDQHWQEVTFTKYSNAGNNMYISGCGIFSFCNAIYALNGIELDAVEVGQWGVDNGSYRPGAGGLYREVFYDNIEADYSQKACFHLGERYYGGVDQQVLIDHLLAGGVAVLHVPGHFIACTGYNPETGLYRVIESAVFTGRGLAPVDWVSAEKLSDGRTACAWFILLYPDVPTLAPTKASVTMQQEAYSINDQIPFILDSDYGYNYTFALCEESGTQVLAASASVDPLHLDPYTYTANVPQAGEYFARVSAANGIGFADSETVPFSVYDQAPEFADCSIKSDDGDSGQIVAAGETVSFSVSSDHGWKTVLHITDEEGNFVADDEFPMQYSETEREISHTFPYAGRYICTAEEINEFGSVCSEPVSLRVSGTVPVVYDVNGGDALSESTSEYLFGELFGSMPIPTKNGYHFAGWFTKRYGGEPVYPTYTVEYDGAFTLYAHWVKNVPDSIPPLQANLIGDINCDLKVDIADAVLLSRLLIEDMTAPIPPAGLDHAEVDGKPGLTIDDLNVLLRYLAQVQEQYPEPEEKKET